MKGSVCNSSTKKRNLIRPSPNEEAAIIQSEQERRKKIRLKQVREQEKAFALKIRQNIKNKRDNELKILSEQLKEQWTANQKEELNNLEKKYQKNLDKLGDGHAAAIKDDDTVKKDGRVLSKQDKQRAIERHHQAVIQLNLERERTQQAENDRAAARAKAMEAEKARAVKIASLPPPRDLVQEFELKEEQKRHSKRAEDFKSTRYHLQQPIVQVERMSKEQQVDARAAAAEEEDKIYGIREGIQRSEAEQAEKARLRHKHALAQLKIEEDRKKLMNDLSELERLDRQRRQDAVARIPVRIFQPPHKRLEDEEERQRDLEQAFEDMYMMQTGYTGDLTIALEPSTDPMPFPEEHQLQVAEDQPKKTPRVPPAAVIPSVTSPQDQESADSSERERSKETEGKKEAVMEPMGEGERMKEPAPAKGEDAVKRLLLRIQRQREQGKKIKEPLATDQQPQKPPSSSRPTTRVTGSRVNILTPLLEEEEPSRDEDTSRTGPPLPQSPTTTYRDVPRGDTTQPLHVPSSVPHSTTMEYSGLTGSSGSDTSRPSGVPLPIPHPITMTYPGLPGGPGSDASHPSGVPAPIPHPATMASQDIPGSVSSDSTKPLRTLLHPYEVAQQVRMMGPLQTEEGTPSSESNGSVPESPMSPQQSELLEQQRLKLKLQEQRRIQERLEEQLNQYHRQFQKISSEVPKGSYVTSDEPSPQPGTRPGSIEEPDSFDQIYVPTRHTSDEDSQRDQGGELLEEGSPTSRTSGTVSLEEQTPDEESATDSSKSTTSDYGNAGQSGALPPRGSLESPTRRSLEDSTHDTSSSDESHGLSSTDHLFQRGTALSRVRDQAAGFLPLEWQKDSHVGPWKTSKYLPSKFQEYPLRTTNHETTGETAPPESSHDSEELESEDLTLSSDSTAGVPHDQLLGLRRNHFQSFSQSDSGFVPTLPLSSVSQRTKTVLDSETSHEKVRDSLLAKSLTQADKVFPSTSSSGTRMSTGSSSLRERQENVPYGTIDSTPVSAVGQTTPSYSRLLDGSPNYIDEYRRKWEEEKKLIENQRQLIRQKQEHQLRRMRYYQDILERYEKRTPTSLDVETSGSLHPRTATSGAATRKSREVTSLISGSFKSHFDSSHRKTDSGIANKENEGTYANASARVPPLGLKQSSSSSDSVFTRISHPWSSSSSSQSGRRFLTNSKIPQAGHETRKSTSTSDFSFPSSGTEYHSLPLSPEVSANMGTGNGSRSSIATLSDLNEMMRKFTSSSENDSGKDLSQRMDRVSGKGSWAEYLSESRVAEDKPTAQYTHPSNEPLVPSTLFTGTGGQTTDAESSRRWYLPAKPSPQSVGSLGPFDEDVSSSYRNLDSPDDGERFDGHPVSRTVAPLGSLTEFISTDAREVEEFGGRGIQIPPKPTTHSIGHHWSLTEFTAAGERKEEDVGGTNRDEGIKPPTAPTTHSIGPLRSVSPGVSPDTSDDGSGTEQWYLPPKSSTQSMGSFGVPSSSSDTSTPHTSTLQYPDRSVEPSASRPQWFVPPKSSLQSIGSPGAFSEGSSPNTSSLKNLENVFNTLQRPGDPEKWYLPILSHDSEKGESSPERSLLLRQSLLRDAPTSMSSGSYTPAYPKSTLVGTGVLGESSLISSSNNTETGLESMGNEGKGIKAGNTSLGHVFLSPSNEHKEDGKASPASLSSGSLVSDTLNKNLSQSESCTTQNSEDYEESDEDTTERTGDEPGNHTMETETTESTGSEISHHGVSTDTEPTEEENLSYSDIHHGTSSSATGLQEAFARRKQDFVKKSLERVERAKAKRFEVTPRVFVKKRVKPDKPVKPDKTDKPVLSNKLSKVGAAKKSKKAKKY